MLGRLLSAFRPKGDPDHWRLGERAAEHHLRALGYTPLGRNVRANIGEIDLLLEAPDKRTVVLVEVKARTARPGSPDRLPERAITSAKARKLASLARSLARRPDLRGRPLRIDVVAVDFEPGSHHPADIRHYPGAINARGQRA